MSFDFHSHVLPGIDDGSQNLDESIQMLRMESEQGISHVVATPHFYPNTDRPERFLRRRREAELRLREGMEKVPGLPQLHVGAEVLYFRGISESEILSDLTIDNKGYILLEIPKGPWPGYIYDEIEQIYLKQGIVPVIAHIERCFGTFRTYDILERLSALPVLVQSNAGFFQRQATRARAMRMLKRGQIHLLGSDCHDLSERPPNLGPVYRMIGEKMGEETVARINSQACQILCNM